MGKKVFASKSEEKRYHSYMKARQEQETPGMTADVPLREIFAQMDQFCLAVEECCKLPELADFGSLAVKSEMVRKMIHGVGVVLNVYNQK